MADIRHNDGMSTLQHAQPPLTLGWRLQMTLDYAGLKYPDIMEHFEVSRGTVSRWCRDVPPRPKRFILEEIARMCGVEADWLIGEDNDNGPGNPPTPIRQTHPRRKRAEIPDQSDDVQIPLPDPMISAHKAA